MRRLTFSVTAIVTWLAACAAAQATLPTDPAFVAWHPWTAKIGWTPPAGDPGYPAIAIVDTGLSSTSTDFAGFLDPASADCSHGSVARRMHVPADVDDPDMHGTQVATLAAAPANGIGSVGASPLSPLIVVRISQSDVAGGVICAFNYLRGVAEAMPLVVNVSQVMPPSRAAQRALDRLVAAGALVVAAAGNDRPTGVRWPASSRHVLAVGRDDGEGAIGPLVDVTAPGDDLLLPGPNGTWATGPSGTSYSAPLVAGAAARIWGELDGDPDPQVLGYLLRRTAHHGRGSGFGEIDLGAALRQPVPAVDEHEPNDTSATAFPKACRRACTLHGIVAAADDPNDVWRLGGRHTCRGLTRLRATPRTATVSCSARRGVVRLLVKAKPHANVAYTVRVPR